MDHDDVVWRLAQLASLPFQERYAINGNADHYILASELLENVDALRHRLQALQLSRPQHAALISLFASIDRYSDEALAFASREEQNDAIRHGRAWQVLRTAANDALKAFDVANDLTIDDIDRLSV